MPTAAPREAPIYSYPVTDPTKELIFQNEVIAQMVAGGWQRGNPEKYDRALALYPEDALGFVQDTQPEQW